MKFSWSSFSYTVTCWLLSACTYDLWQQGNIHLTFVPMNSYEDSALLSVMEEIFFWLIRHH